MAKLTRLQGTIKQTVYVFIQDSSVTTGAGKTGLAFNSSGLTAYYVSNLGNSAAITLATQTVTGAWSSGGFVEVDATNMKGVYRFDIPNAALASGDSVVICFQGATNAAPCLLEIDLSSLMIRTGTAQAGANGSITLDASANATNAFYTDQLILITGGTGVGQARLISGYTGSTKVATVVPNWVTNPDSTSIFVIVPSGQVDLGLWLQVSPAALSTNGYVQSLIARWLTDSGGGTPNALISGRVDANVGVNNDKTGYELDATGSAAMTEGYRANGATGTISQLLYEILAHLSEAAISGTTKTTKKLDHSTTAATYTLDNALTPASVTRAT